MVTNIHYKSDVVDYSTWTADQWANDEQDGVSSVQERIEEYEPEGDGWDEGYLWYRDEERDQDGDPEENWFDGDNPDEMKLEHMIVLADGYGSGGRAIVLDVFKGNIHEDMLECNLLSEVPVEDFFDDLKAKFERLELVPVPGTARREGRLYGDMNGVPEVNDFGESLAADEDDAAQQYKAIWQNFGWPGNDYLKEEAIAAIRLHAERREEADDGGEHAH